MIPETRIDLEAVPDLEAGIAPRFEQVVAHFPDRIAVKVDDHAISYAEFNAKANQIARLLVNRFGPDPAPVALLFGAGPGFYVAMMAVLKAGKYYVPLDPKHPAARSAAIFNAADPQVTLTDRQHAAMAAQLVGDGSWIDVDRVTLPTSAENLCLPVPPDAYVNVMFTSGSTGRPKGVIQAQRNTLHALFITAPVLRHRSDDRFAQLLSPSFGASVINTFGALLLGGTLLPYSVKRQGIDGLADWLRRERITTYHSVPTVFRHLIFTLGPNDTFPDMRILKLGGEPVYRHDIDNFKRYFPRGAVLRSGLGSTEAYLATYKILGHDSVVDTPLVSLGIITPDMHIDLVDADGNPVPEGTSGEIAVRSRYLSPGYWRDPEATAASYRIVPGSDERIYLTGDLGYWLPNGELMHLGRADGQVKIRGNRVETAEVEVALLELESVRETAVVALEREPGELALAAYNVPQSGKVIDSAELRAHLISKLPPYMIPSAFMTLDALPLLPFGKVNHKALPQPQWEAVAPFVAPETRLQQQIAAIWADILNLEQVGLNDDFFALGGDSLRAGQVISRLRVDLGLNVSETALFEAPQLGQLADFVVQAQLDQLSADELDDLLNDIAGLSDDDIAQLLAADE